MAGHPKNRLYIDSGASVHILFNQEFLEGIVDLDRPMKIAAGGKNINLSQVGSLHTALRHLLLPVNGYHYDDNTIANLLSFARLADDYYILCNTRIDDAIAKIYRILIRYNLIDQRTKGMRCNRQRVLQINIFIVIVL